MRSIHEATRPLLREVADGVHAYLQPDGGWCLNNAGVIRSGPHVALVDTAATEARARLLRDHVTAVEPTPPEFMINTHFHGDHTFGNYLFAPATIVAARDTRTDVAAAGLHLTGLWPDVDWGHLTVAPPTVSFDDRMTVHVGDTPLELVNVGAAHTRSDTVVWLPEQRVLFTGDVVMSGVTPFVPMGSVSGSLAALDVLRALGAETVISGHGVPTGPEVFDAVETYLRWLQNLARDGRAAGLTPLDVARQTDLGDFAGWLDSARLVPNLHRAYADDAGIPAGTGVDVVGVFREMVTFHGGPLPCRA